MKLLSTKEIQDKKAAELSKDISRTESVKKALETATNELNETNARFNLALANQRVRWTQEEKEALDQVALVTEEIKVLEIKKKELCIPIEEREKKSYALFTEAEKVLAEAHSKFKEAERLQQENERTTELLQEKLDGVYETESSLEEREKKVYIRELAIEEERDSIRKLSQELSIKLNNLK